MIIPIIRSGKLTVKYLVSQANHWWSCVLEQLEDGVFAYNLLRLASNILTHIRLIAYKGAF
ncbi:hypothetical protein [Paenibacillus sp. GCM10027626]|uniref:hypothetical protein n=1 Tax=Paenibacillus sp. GCM10027626 TaxID=3273411 RepID=UPI003624EA82